MKLLFITPPFTQLNTPYPATAYLKGFMNTLGIESYQADLGIEVVLHLFSSAGLQQIFKALEPDDIELSDNTYRMFRLRSHYISTIDSVIAFLQNKNPTLAHSICSRKFLPEASRFQSLEDLDWAFGSMGIQDQARHFATLYLEDLGDLITEVIDPHFGFSRYAERLARTATHFDPILAALQAPETIVTQTLTHLLAQKLAHSKPNVVCITVPFPGNLFGALKCGQFIKQHHPDIKIVLGGGYANTELRSMTDERLFDFIDYLSLDDGEAPLQCLIEHLAGKRLQSHLKRMFARINGVVSHLNGATEKDIAQRAVGTPDYSDLPLQDYISVIEVVNPMHRLWSDGRWNKLTLAHGCYWGKCSFCDVTLNYIKDYEPVNAALLCDRIETIIAQTGQNGFHFVDEAAPPALMRDLAIEILRRKLTVVWWTNIRFEKSFTPDLCILLKASGCIAVSGGLEVASDRLLARMQKGVTVAQVARVSDAFTRAGIMVHAYLMYGFPTQTAQETIDSLEYVRQMFNLNILKSGFWHQFAMTAHSPVGLDPASYGVVKTGPDLGGFADNDLYHDDPQGADHELFSDGLKKSLFNFMHGVGLDFPLHKWFDFKTPKTTVPSDYILNAVSEPDSGRFRPNAIVLWLGEPPETLFVEDDIAQVEFFHPQGALQIEMDIEVAQWLKQIMPRLCIGAHEPITFNQLAADFEKTGLGNFADFFMLSSEWEEMAGFGLLVV